MLGSAVTHIPVYAHVACTLAPVARAHEAGTGKSFLLTTVYLWCLLKRKKVKAAAPWEA